VESVNNAKTHLTDADFCFTQRKGTGVCHVEE
jgi:hypothetical protein